MACPGYDPMAPEDDAGDADDGVPDDDLSDENPDAPDEEGPPL
jgi:hypothetical protein